MNAREAETRLQELQAELAMNKDKHAEIEDKGLDIIAEIDRLEKEHDLS